LHMNMSDLKDEEKYAVFGAYAATQDFWDEQVQTHRHENNYCTRMNVDRLFADIQTSIGRGTEFNQFARNYGRYNWMNAGAIIRHNTFENRLHHATWDYNEVKKWIVLNLRFVRAARHLRVQRGESLAAYRERAMDAVRFATEFFEETPSTEVARAIS